MNKSTKNQYSKQLTAWYGQPLGLEIAKHERELCEEVLSHLFGYHALQIGFADISHWLAKSPIKHRICLESAPSHSSDFIGVVGHIDNLPFKPDSLDLVLLPHTLESLPDPMSMLPTVIEEISQLLIPEGYLLIIGFNRRGLWGLKQFFSNASEAPWSGQCLSLKSVRAACEKVGLDIKVLKTAFHALPSANPSKTSRFSLLTRLCSICFPNSGSVYAMLAKKKVSQPTLVGVSWKKQNMLVKDSVTEPTTRGVSRE